MNLTESPTIARRLLDDGFAEDAARAWATCPLPLPGYEIVGLAHEWRTHGLDGADAAAWCTDGWPPQIATLWHLQGYTPEQARFVEIRLVLATHAWRESNRCAAEPDKPPTWRDSGLSPDTVTLCIARGLTRVEQGYALAADMEADPTLRGTLELLADVRGIDLRAMRTPR